MKVKKVQFDNDLFTKYSTQAAPQPVYLSLDLPSETLQYESNYEIGSIPIDVFNKMRLWFGPVPTMRRDKANSVLDKFYPIAMKILENVENLDGNRPEWSDNETAFELEETASFFAETLINSTNPDEIFSPWDFDSYFDSTDLDGIGENGLSVHSTPEEIKAAAEYEFENASVPLDGDVDELVDWIAEWIDRTWIDMQDEE